MSNELPIAEQFYSIQGEGPYAGTPAVFLRTAGCNLACGGHENLKRDKEDWEPEGNATWVCDTMDVWTSAQEKIGPRDLVTEFENRGWASVLDDGAHLILTGGEPLIPSRQEQLAKFLSAYVERNDMPYVEVETNGTRKPESNLDRFVNLYNVSMKLENSGMPYSQRVNHDALNFFTGQYQRIGDSTTMFKFVVSDDDDIDEIETLIDSHGIPSKQVSLMPAGQRQEQIRETYPKVMEICKEKNYTFSPRLHVDAWNKQTGV